jgi:hypothetical protein
LSTRTVEADVDPCRWPMFRCHHCCEDQTTATLPHFGWRFEGQIASRWLCSAAFPCRSRDHRTIPREATWIIDCIALFRRSSFCRFHKKADRTGPSTVGCLFGFRRRLGFVSPRRPRRRDSGASKTFAETGRDGFHWVLPWWLCFARPHRGLRRHPHEHGPPRRGMRLTDYYKTIPMLGQLRMRVPVVSTRVVRVR